MIALHTCLATIVIASENAVVAGRAALLESRRSHPLLLAAACVPAIGPCLSAARLSGVPGSHCAIPVRHTQAMARVVRPSRVAHPALMEMIKAVAMKE
jgi:hypothetical protein